MSGATYHACAICRAPATLESPVTVSGITSIRYTLTCGHADQPVALLEMPGEAPEEQN